MYLTPDIVARPSAPVLEMYNPHTGLNDRENFRKFQTNNYLMYEYIINLNSTIDYYENAIQNLKQR